MPEAIRGLDELKRKLEELGVEGREGKKVFRVALRQAGNVVRDAARANAPVGTGLLKRRIQTVSARGKPGTIRFQVRAAAHKVSPKYPEGYPYAQAVEEGHGFPNTRQRQFSSARELKTQEFGTGKVPPRPFLRPAFLSTQNAVLDKFGEEAGRRIEKLAQYRS
jgi:HK97 gp10 family phage protein